MKCFRGSQEHAYKRRKLHRDRSTERRFWKRYANRRIRRAVLELTKGTACRLGSTCSAQLWGW